MENRLFVIYLKSLLFPWSFLRLHTVDSHVSFEPTMLHELLRTWFQWVEQWGYWGVFVLMAMESSIIPVPSEVVLPPAAFWAAQGRMSLSGVILSATLGSYVGSAISYWVSRWVGQPVVQRFGKYFFLPPKKLELAEDWVRQFGTFGIFAARLLPVIRHLISIPAGVFRMSFLPFSVATLTGAGLWCAILSWFGQEVLGSHPELLQSPEEMVHVIKAKMVWIVAGVVILGGLYLGVLVFKKRSRPLALH
jgi:membrane protein DedA with SNARE-associated domain